MCKKTKIISVLLALMLAVGLAQTAFVQAFASEKAESIKGIEITKLPDKLTYVRNCEWVDMLGSQITVSYTDGSTEVIAPKFNDVPFLSSPEFDDGSFLCTYDKRGDSYLGKGTITVSYGGCTDEFEVDWIENPVASIELLTKPGIFLENKAPVPGDERCSQWDEAQWWDYAKNLEVNMYGAELFVSYKDGSTGTYTFDELLTDDFYEIGKYGIYNINGFYAQVNFIPMENDWGIEILYPGSNAEQLNMFMLSELKDGESTPSEATPSTNNGSQGAQGESNEDNNSPSDETTKNNSSTSDVATNDRVNNGADNTAVQTGATAPTVLLLIVLASALTAVYFYRRKLSK